MKVKEDEMGKRVKVENIIDLYFKRTK